MEDELFGTESRLRSNQAEKLVAQDKRPFVSEMRG